MRKTLVQIILVASIFVGFGSEDARAQIDEDQTGAWYMYFWSARIKEGPWGFQGDLQYRNWNLGGDLEQLLLRGGLTYKPKNASILFTLGYGHITTGAYDSSDIVSTEVSSSFFEVTSVMIYSSYQDTFRQISCPEKNNGRIKHNTCVPDAPMF